jgi:hypothetical protein
MDSPTSTLSATKEDTTSQVHDLCRALGHGLEWPTRYDAKYSDVVAFQNHCSSRAELRYHRSMSLVEGSRQGTSGGMEVEDLDGDEVEDLDGGR